MNLTNEDLERIEELQEWFETDDDLADSDRISIGSKICALMDLYASKCKVYESMTNLDSDMVEKLAELKAMYELFKDLHEKYIRLDNYRCNNLHKLCSILAYTDLKLSDKIKKYEF